MTGLLEGVLGAMGESPPPPARSAGNYDQLFAQAGQQYGVAPELLRAVAKTESGFNPNAVSNQGARGLMQLIPPTAKALGVSDPHDPAQAIPAAAQLLRQNLDASGGDVETALKMYHGGPNRKMWGEKTAAYPGLVAKNGADLGKAPTAFGGFSADAVANAIDSATEAPSKAAPAAKTIQADASKPRSTQQASAGMAGMSEAAQTIGSGLARSVTGGYQGLFKLMQGLKEGKSFTDAMLEAEPVVKAEAAKAYQPTTPEGQRILANLNSDYSPLTWPAKIGGLAGDAIQAGASAAGASPAVQGALATAADTGVQAALPATFLKLKGALSRTPAQPVPEPAATPPGASPQALAQPAGPSPLDVPAYLRRRQPVPATAAPEPVAAPRPLELAPIDEAVTGRPATPQPLALVPQEPPRVPTTNTAYQQRLQAEFERAKQGANTPPQPAPTTTAAPSEPLNVPDLTFPARGTAAAAIESPHVEGGLPPEIQKQRAAVLQRVGIDRPWTSALSGNAMDGAVNTQIAKTDTPAGHAAKAVFDAERAALENYATDTIRQTGGTVGVDESALHARGQAIAKPIDDLNAYFDGATKALYDEAHARAQGRPVDTPKLDALLADPEFANTLGAVNRDTLLKHMQSQLAEFKKRNAGNFDVKVAEQYRQWLNEIWSSDISKFIGKVKGALDDDVFKSAGEDVYGQSRAIHQLRKETLDNPKGIGKLFEFDPNTPINRTTPFEKTPDAVMRMSTDQFGHLIKTLKEMPPELQPQAQAALAEIKAQFTNRMAETGGKFKGGWNSSGVNDFLSANSDKLKQILTPEETARIADLRAAGNITAVNGNYPGAAAQAINLSRQGIASRLATHAATSVGGATGSLFGPAGAAVGAVTGRAVGESLASKAADAAALRTVQKRMTKLSDMLQ